MGWCECCSIAVEIDMYSDRLPHCTVRHCSFLVKLVHMLANMLCRVLRSSSSPKVAKL